MRFFLLFALVSSALFAHGYATKRCEQAAWGGNTLPFDATGKFVPECAPDVLYTWQSRKTVAAWEAAARAGKRLPITKPIFTWRTPIGTFAYGGPDGVGVRLKLKDGVKFTFTKNGGDGADGVTAALNPDVSYSEYILGGDEAIASWSFGLAENIAEMTREKTWIETHARGEYDQYVRPRAEMREQFEVLLRENGIARALLFFDFAIDVTPGSRYVDWSREALVAKLAKQREWRGGVFGAGDHWKIRTPNYFNP